MALADTQLYQLGGFDPYTTMVQAPMQRRQAEIKAMQTEQAYKEAQTEMGQQALPQIAGQAGQAPLAGMAKSMLPPTYKLATEDGIPTAAGLFNQQTVNSQQDLSASQKIMQQARFMEPGSKEQINAISEARRLQTTATQNMSNAKKEYQRSMDDALESVYNANSQSDYDKRVKDALERTGIPAPKNLPEVWSPAIKEKILSQMSPEARNKVEKEDRARRDEIRKEKSAELRDQHMVALLRDKAGGGKETPAQSRIVQALTQTSDALENVARLPITTTGPMFQQKQFNSLYTAPLSALNQELSDETSQMLQTRMTGVSRGLAALESGGAATGLVGLTESIEKGTFIQAGSKLNVALDKLGEMRRIVESSAKAMLNDPNLSPERKKLIQDELDIVKKSIPFTQADIDRARKESKTNPDLSFTEFTTLKPIGGEKPSKTGTAPQAALDYLKSNPSQKEAFKAKYGYLPEGM